MTSKTTLTSADIENLKAIFATKEDLVKFATKEDLVKFATKEDLAQLTSKEYLKQQLEDLLAEIVTVITKQKFDERLTDHEERIHQLEEKAAFL